MASSGGVLKKARDIPGGTQALLYAVTAGRCEFRGCNKSLVEHHLTLMQGGKPDATVAGIVGVRVTGQLNGVAALVDGVGTTPKGAISFKYYQSVDYQLALPAGFHPAAVQVTVRDNRPNGITATQSFPWSVDVQP